MRYRWSDKSSRVVGTSAVALPVHCPTFFLEKFMMDRDTIVCDRKIMPESDDGDQQHGSASTQSSWRTTRIASGCAVLAFCGLLSIRMRKLLQFRRLAEQQVYKNVDPQKPWIKKSKEERDAAARALRDVDWPPLFQDPWFNRILFLTTLERFIRADLFGPSGKRREPRQGRARNKQGH